MSQVICPEPGSQMTIGSVTFAPSADVRNYPDAFSQAVLERDALARENVALRALAVDYATFSGEMSKALHHDDPTWREMYELGKRLREILMGSNVQVQGPGAALSPQAPARLPGSATVPTEE